MDELNLVLILILFIIFSAAEYIYDKLKKKKRCHFSDIRDLWLIFALWLLFSVISYIYHNYTIFEADNFGLLSIGFFTLITSCYYAIRIATMYYMYNAEANVFTYIKLGDGGSMEVAKRWLEQSNWWFRTSKRNGFFTFCGFSSIFFGILYNWKECMLLLLIAWGIISFVVLYQVFILKYDCPGKDHIPFLSNLLIDIFNDKAKVFKILAPPDRSGPLKDLIFKPENQKLKEIYVREKAIK